VKDILAVILLNSVLNSGADVNQNQQVHVPNQVITHQQVINDRRISDAHREVVRIQNRINSVRSMGKDGRSAGAVYDLLRKGTVYGTGGATNTIIYNNR